MSSTTLKRYDRSQCYFLDLKSLTDLDVCSNALKLITRLVTECPELSQKLFKPMGFLRKLAKLCSPFEGKGKLFLLIQVTLYVLKKNLRIQNQPLLGQHDKKTIMAIHNQAVTLIKILVLSSECMPEVASINLIGQMIKLCQIFFKDSPHASCCYDNMRYPPKATSYFHDLVHGVKLIGKVREIQLETSRKVVEDCKVEGMIRSCSMVSCLVILLVSS